MQYSVLVLLSFPLILLLFYSYFHSFFFLTVDLIRMPCSKANRKLITMSLHLKNVQEKHTGLRILLDIFAMFPVIKATPSLHLPIKMIIQTPQKGRGTGEKLIVVLVKNRWQIRDDGCLYLCELVCVQAPLHLHLCTFIGADVWGVSHLRGLTAPLWWQCSVGLKPISDAAAAAV